MIIIKYFNNFYHKLKMSLFYFKFYKTYFYFVVYWVLDLLNNIEWGNFQSKFNYQYYYDNYDKNIIINNKYFFPFAVETELLNLTTLIFADLCFGLLVAYTYISMKGIGKITNEFEDNLRMSKMSIELIYNQPSYTKNSLVLIITISLLDFVARSMELFFFLIVCTERAEEKNIRWLITMEILPRIVFCYFILKVKLYRHHYLSILLFFIGFLFISIFGIKSIEGKNQKKYVFTLVIPKIIYALEDTLTKIILTDKFILPHFLLFYRGIINTVLVLIVISILLIALKIDFQYYSNIINNISIIEILLKFLSFTFMMIKIFCIFKIIYIFTPQHVGFCIVVIYFYNAIKNLIVTKDFQNEIYYFLLNTICLILIGFGTIIFNEMLIIKICGLDENTKSGIIKREQIESIELKNTISSENSDNDDDDDNTGEQISKRQ